MRFSWRWPASITGKLALLYALLALVILSAVTAVLYWAVVVSLAQDDRRFLSEKVHVLRTMLSERPGDSALLREEVDWETRVLGHARYFVQILSRDGKVITETPGLTRSGIDQKAFPVPIAATAMMPHMRSVRTASGRSYLLSAAFARLGVQGQPQRIIRLAIDVSHEDRVLAEFRRIAAFVLVTGVVLSALLGAVLARYGLKPLGNLARTVAATTALRLDQRIDPASWPREFADLAEALNRLLAHLEDAFVRLSGYAADLAHELRTPINNLMGETEVMLARPRSVVDYEQTLTSNLEEYQRIARMIDSLLFLARAESAEGPRTTDCFDAGAALREVVEFYRPAAEEAGVGLEGLGEASLVADRDLFRRALSNLLDNAIRHSVPGGRVSAVVETLGDGAVCVMIADTGSGIAAGERERVFDRFFRGADSRKDSRGSGLGLAIVKSIMRLHGGEVRLASDLGRGTTVTLVFPA